jgi:zinc protease
MDSNFQKVTREDIIRYIKKYIAGQPMVAGLIISPDMNKQINANSFFAAK